MKTCKYLLQKKLQLTSIFYKCIVITLAVALGHTFSQMNGYLETFDSVSALNELLIPSSWHAINLAPASTNTLEIVGSPYGSSPHSLKASAMSSSTVVSKASIERKGYSFVAGDTLLMQASFYFEPGADLNDIYLMDIECEECYTQRPGPRLKVTNGFIYIDRSKIGIAGSFRGFKAIIPTGEWFQITWQMVLGKNLSGITRVFLNGLKVLDTTGTNIPDSAIFSAAGVSLTAEKLDRFEVGLTANSSSKAAVLYVDDIFMGKGSVGKVMSVRSQKNTPRRYNHTSCIFFGPVSDAAQLPLDLNWQNNTYVYDILGRHQRMLGNIEWGKEIYLARFSK